MKKCSKCKGVGKIRQFLYMKGWVEVWDWFLCNKCHGKGIR